MILVLLHVKLTLDCLNPVYGAQPESIHIEPSSADSMYNYIEAVAVDDTIVIF